MISINKGEYPFYIDNEKTQLIDYNKAQFKCEVAIRSHDISSDLKLVLDDRIIHGQPQPPSFLDYNQQRAQSRLLAHFLALHLCLPHIQSSLVGF